MSLTAELLLLALDPDGEGLVGHDRSRLRKALGATAGLSGRRARRAALRELENARAVGRGGMLGPIELVDRRAAGELLRRVCRCLGERGTADLRDWELLVLLGWTGVLKHRLGRDERRVALRRLRELFRASADGEDWKLPGESARSTPAWVSRLGGIAAVASDIELYEAPAMAEFGTDHSAFRPYTGA